MKKSGLKTGHICVHRNGKYSMVSKDNFETEAELVFHSSSRTSLKKFDKYTFEWCREEKNRTDYVKSIDIVSVYQPKFICNGFEIFEKDASQVNTSNWKLLWQNTEPDEMTTKEKCKLLGKKKLKSFHKG